MLAAYEAPALRAALDDALHPGGAALTDELLAGAALPAGALVADLGCGAGITASRLCERHRCVAVGIDLSQQLLRVGRQRDAALPLVRADAGRLPLADGVLDAVVAECSLSTLPDLDTALTEVARVLKPGGRLIASDVYLRHDRPDEVGLQRAGGPLTQARMVEDLVRHGFSITLWRDRSDALKLYAARLILAGVPLPAINCECGANLGYCWFVAHKN